MNVIIMDLGSRVNTFGGQARVAAMLQKNLSKYFKTYYLGYETEYIKPSASTIMLKRSKKLGLSLRKSRLSEIGILRFGYNLLVVRGMRDLGMDKNELVEKIKQIKPDVMIANSIQDIVLLRYLKKRGIEFKSIYIDHGSLTTNTVSGYLSKEGVPLTIGTGVFATSVEGAKRKFIDFFDMNVAISKNQLQNMKLLTGKVTYIPNGVPKDLSSSERRLASTARKYNLHKRDFVLLFIGRMFERQKNVSTLIKAFRGIKDRNMKLLIIGDGPSLPDYNQLAGDDSRIIFGGTVNDSNKGLVYDLTDLFVLPSNWEGFSLTMLEAANHSLPMILSDNSYIDDLKESGIGKIISFHTKNPDDLREKILFLYGNKRAMTTAAATSMKIAKRFSESQMTLKYKDMINKVVDKK